MIDLSLSASLQQAAFDVALTFALFVLYRLLHVWRSERRYQRATAKREAQELAVYRAAEQKRYERSARPRKRGR